jgi:hypothetical protein
MEGLTEGRIVHYVLDDGPCKGQHRPAVVVRVWRVKNEDGSESPSSNGVCQLQVFTDEDNDGLPAMVWITSCEYNEDAQPRSWHWIERE